MYVKFLFNKFTFAQRTRVALDRTPVLTAAQHFSAPLPTLPHLAPAPPSLWRLLPATAARVDSLWTGRAWARVAQQHTLVPARRFQWFSARFAARVRQQPRVELGILLLCTVAVVTRWKVLPVILSPTFRAKTKTVMYMCMHIPS